MRYDEISQVVKERYSKAAETYRAGTSSGCCASAAPASAGFAAQHGLYTPEDLAAIPPISLNLSKGCGNPTSFADLRPGDVVVDLGCGAGIDTILAARKVAPGGEVIGVDFAPGMNERARQAVADAGVTENVQLVLAALEKLDLPSDFADVVISNCVINLCPDKEAVYREAFRILKPGGRLAISDMEYSEAPDPQVKAHFEATWAGCMGGAMEEQAYLELIKQAGFEELHIVTKHTLDPKELEEMARCPGPEFTPLSENEDMAGVQGKLTSIKFTAVKPLTR
jgi:ubiquinone/menaquinone biosynthesis C-methylase UbiE